MLSKLGGETSCGYAYRYGLRVMHFLDTLQRSSVKIGTIQRRLAWLLCKDDTLKSRTVSTFLCACTIHDVADACSAYSL
jgi:hypothetical protein